MCELFNKFVSTTQQTLNLITKKTLLTLFKNISALLVSITYNG